MQVTLGMTDTGTHAHAMSNITKRRRSPWESKLRRMRSIAAGRKIVRTRTQVRPGVVIGMVEDPDGNWVEFIQAP